ncbi:MAG: hypothetical protein II436_05915 [Oscillospiraceae bacterium]|nr:hypothetical protein [Oscillospiraceae bacterium]
MFPAYAREGKPEPKPVQAVNSKIVIDDNASGGYEGDYVVIYNPSTSSSSSYSTGTMTGLIDTTINANIQNSASINDESDLPLYKIDVDSYLDELAKSTEGDEPAGTEIPNPVKASFNVGDTKTFSILSQYSPTGSGSVQFKCLYVGQHCYIWTPHFLLQQHLSAGYHRHLLRQDGRGRV